MIVKPDEDVLLGLLPFYHIYGLVIVQFGALARGTKLVILPKFEPVSFLESIQNHKVLYRKNPKNSEPETFAVIILKFEQGGFTIE